MRALTWPMSDLIGSNDASADGGMETWTNWSSQGQINRTRAIIECIYI